MLRHDRSGLSGASLAEELGPMKFPRQSVMRAEGLAVLVKKGGDSVHAVKIPPKNKSRPAGGSVSAVFARDSVDVGQPELLNLGGALLFTARG